jgi:uncharacterized protein YkwD
MGAVALTLAASGAQAAADLNGSIEQQVLELINVQRANHGLAAVLLDLNLDAAAEAHALDMATTPCFQHESCDGTPTFTRVKAYYTPSTWLGEIIAAGYTTPAAVVDGWMNSPGHRANILDGNFKVAGVAMAYSSVGSFGSYWVVDFGGQVTSATVPASVPEPSAWALMALGLLSVSGAAARARRG